MSFSFVWRGTGLPRILGKLGRRRRCLIPRDIFALARNIGAAGASRSGDPHRGKRHAAVHPAEPEDRVPLHPRGRGGDRAAGPRQGAPARLVQEASGGRQVEIRHQRHRPHREALHAVHRRHDHRLHPAAGGDSAARDQRWRADGHRWLGFRQDHGQQPRHAPGGGPSGEPDAAVQVPQLLVDPHAEGLELPVPAGAEPRQPGIRAGGRRGRYRHLHGAGAFPVLRHCAGRAL